MQEGIEYATLGKVQQVENDQNIAVGNLDKDIALVNERIDKLLGFLGIERIALDEIGRHDLRYAVPPQPADAGVEAPPLEAQLVTLGPVPAHAHVALGHGPESRDIVTGPPAELDAPPAPEQPRARAAQESSWD